MKYIDLNDFEDTKPLLAIKGGEIKSFPKQFLEHYDYPESVKIIGERIGFRMIYDGKYVCLKAL